MYSYLGEIIILLLSTALGTEYLPLYGSPEQPGYFYTEVFIGSQESPRKLIIDIGFDLLLIRCSGCKSCGKSLNNYYNFSESSQSHVLNSQKNIDYSSDFTNGKNTSGFFIQDELKFYSKNKYIQVKTLIGCNTIESGFFLENPSDGVIGFPTIKSSYSFLDSISEHKLIDTPNYSICVGDLGGYIALGISNFSMNSSNIIWQKLSNLPKIKIQNIYIGLKKVPLSSNEKFLISTGSTLTYLKKPLFTNFMKLFEEYCEKNNNCHSKSTKVNNFEGACYQHSFHNLETFPSLIFKTDEGDIEFRPDSYMIKVHSVRLEIFCVGIMMNQNQNILGANFMRFKNFYFDVERSRLGIAESQCDFLPNITQAEYFMYEMKKNEILVTSENLVIFFSISAVIYLVTMVLVMIINRVLGC